MLQLQWFEHTGLTTRYACNGLSAHLLKMQMPRSGIRSSPIRCKYIGLVVWLSSNHCMRYVWVHYPCLFALQVCQATHFSIVLNALNVISHVPGVLGSHGFWVFMVSFALFVSTLVALTNDVVLTNAKGVSQRNEGTERYREREGKRMRKRYRQNLHRGDSNPWGQSPMDFESISLTARTQCLGEGSQI